MSQTHKIDKDDQTRLNSKSVTVKYEKPTYTYTCLIALAIKNSANGALPPDLIYEFVLHHFPYFQKEQQWRIIPDRLDYVARVVNKYNTDPKNNIQKAMKYPHLINIMQI